MAKVRSPHRHVGLFGAANVSARAALESHPTPWLLSPAAAPSISCHHDHNRCLGSRKDRVIIAMMIACGGANNGESKALCPLLDDVLPFHILASSLSLSPPLLFPQKMAGCFMACGRSSSMAPGLSTVTRQVGERWRGEREGHGGRSAEGKEVDSD
eukprot:752528-Hanusia_phi.AAC.2